MKNWLKMLAVASLVAASSGAALGWGAIAVDDKEGGTQIGYGYWTGANSEAEAKRGALRECRKHKNKNCKEMIAFETCGAYASNKDRWGVAEGRSENASRRLALFYCGEAACKVGVSVCN